MKLNMSKTRSLFFLISMLLTQFAVMYSTIFQVINYDIYEAFPDNRMAVNFFISGPYVLVMIVSFISPYIYRRSNRKTSLLIACIIFTESALLFTHQTTIYGFIVVNLICGASSAYINVSAVTLIAEIYIDESVKSRYYGYYNAAMAGVGSIFSVIAGYFAQKSWIGAFNVYWSAVLMTIFVLLFIPSMPAKSMNEPSQDIINGHFDREKPSITKLGVRFWILTMNFIVLGITYFVPGFFLSIYIAEHGLGDITYAGIALSVDTLGGAVFSFFFHRIYKVFNSYTSVAAFVLMSVALFALYFFPNPVLLVFIVIFMGASYMTMISYAYQESSKVVPKSCVALSLGIIVGVQYIATFFAAYITTGLMNLMQTGKLTPTLIFPASWILLFAIIEYFSIKSFKKVDENIR